MAAASYKYIVNGKIEQIYGGSRKEIINDIEGFLGKSVTKNTKIEFSWGAGYSRIYRGSLITSGGKLKPDLKLTITLKEREERKQFIEFLDYCKKINITKDDEFFKLIRAGGDLYKLTDYNLSALFGIPKLTISKWKIEQSPPELIVRNIVLRQFKRITKEKINDTREKRIKRNQEKRVRPNPPRYDEVFFKGTELLDKL